MCHNFVSQVKKALGGARPCRLPAAAAKTAVRGESPLSAEAVARQN